MQGIEPIHLLRLNNLMEIMFVYRKNTQPENSAKYYVIYTLFGFGSTFTSLHGKLKDMIHLEGHEGRRLLKNGRDSLIEDGMLAEILFYHKDDRGKTEEGRVSKGENYLPINPVLIHNEVTQRSEGQYELSPGEHNLLEELYDKWESNFKEHGFLFDTGILSVYCSAPWLQFALMNYLSSWKKEEKTLYIITSSTSWCRPPLFSSLSAAVERGLELRVLLGTSKKTEELKNLKSMENVNIRKISKEAVVTDRLTFAGSNYVSNMHKILGYGGKYSRYVATLYLNQRDIAKEFKTSFEGRWERASPL